MHGPQHNQRPARQPGQACLPCSKSKLRCERGLPCKRCKVKGLECRYPDSGVGPSTPAGSHNVIDIHSPVGSAASECIAVQTEDTTAFGEINLEGWSHHSPDTSSISTIPADTTFASQLDGPAWHQSSTDISINNIGDGMENLEMSWNPHMSNFAFPWFMDGLDMTFDVPDFEHQTLPLLTPSASISNTAPPQTRSDNTSGSYLRPIAICSPYTKTCKSFPVHQEASLELAGAEIYGHIQHVPQQASEGLEVFYRSQCHGYPPFLPPPILHAFVELYFESFDPDRKSVV